MNRAQIVEHLETAERQLAEGQQRIARQGEILAELHGGGHNVALAGRVLEILQRTQEAHVVHCNRLKRLLADV